MADAAATASRHVDRDSSGSSHESAIFSSTRAMGSSGNARHVAREQQLVQRRPHFGHDHVRVTVREVASPSPTPEQFRKQRVQEIQTVWTDIKGELPPQLTRVTITMISIGGVIGTGVFLGISQSLTIGGPMGLLLGYFVVGLIVISVVTSVAEIVAWLPNVGGIIRLADLYVDPALGFAMGWNAWYNWAVILPAEVTAATVLVEDFTRGNVNINPWVTVAVLGFAIFINCFGARTYGHVEFWFATGKIITMVFLIVVSIYLDARKGGLPNGDRIGLHYWFHPGPFAQYDNIKGPFGRFLAFWAVMIQAAFSFFGAEVPGVAGSEVVQASKNIPRAVRRIWLRVLLFYVLSVFMAGLLVAHDDPELTPAHTDSLTSISSPFVIAMRRAGGFWKVVSVLVNVGFISSAWSAASSDVYISSRYLFFLARCHHAPEFFGRLFHRRITDDPAFTRTPSTLKPGSGPAARMSATFIRSVDQNQEIAHSQVNPPPSLMRSEPVDTRAGTSISPPHSDLTETQPAFESIGSSNLPHADASPESSPSSDSLLPVAARFTSRSDNTLAPPVFHSHHRKHGTHTSDIDRQNEPDPEASVGSATLGGRGMPPIRRDAGGSGARAWIEAGSRGDELPNEARGNGGEGREGEVNFQPTERPTRTRVKKYDQSKTIPWVGVLVAGIIGCLAFLGSSQTRVPVASSVISSSNSTSAGSFLSGPQNQTYVEGTAASRAFTYLSSMTSVAALQSWICMLITYLRWHRGYEVALKDPSRVEFKDSDEAKWIKEHRGFGQPWTARLGLIMCLLILFFNGWSVFYNDPHWVISFDSCEAIEEVQQLPIRGSVPPVAKFLTSYLPLPIFLMLYFGYKLLKPTQVVQYIDMPFEKGMIRDFHTDLGEAEDNVDEYYAGRHAPEGEKWFGVIKWWIAKGWYIVF